jgi:diguanylate cyclase (GGDEF)-like protein
VTISLGIACVKEGESEIELFERADKAMYEAKRKGRNKVEIAE